MIERNKTIDIARGIGMILVIVGHFWQTFVLGGVIGSFHMPLMMFISGMCFKTYSVAERTKKTLIRAGVPYVLTWGICTLFFGCGQVLEYGFSLHNMKDFWYEQIISLAYGYATSGSGVKGVGVIWFLASLIFAQIIFNIIENTISNVKIKLLLVALIFVVGEYIRYHAVIPWWIASGGTYFLIWLSLGYYFKVYFDDIMSISRVKVFTVNIVIVTLWAIYMILMLSGYRGFRFGALAPIMFVLWFSEILGRNKTIGSIMEWIGQNTMWIMCIHSFEFLVWIRFGLNWEFIM